MGWYERNIIIGVVLTIVVCIALTIWIANADIPLWLKFMLLK